MNEENAIEILEKYMKQKNLLRHSIAVQSVMKEFARKYGEDENKWGTIGLLHDIDYEMYPDEHCVKCKEILEKEGFSEEYIHAIRSHGYGICSDIEPVEKMEKVLYTIDELTGLVVATALMKPSKKLEEVDLESLKKKWKQKGFAAGANRQLIQKGAEILGESLEDIMKITLDGMKKVSEEIGL